MTELQALITGLIAGQLAKTSDEEDLVLIDVDIVMDDNGYTNQILVTGRVSGERLLVTVEPDA